MEHAQKDELGPEELLWLESLLDEEDIRLEERDTPLAQVWGDEKLDLEVEHTKHIMGTLTINSHNLTACLGIGVYQVNGYPSIPDIFQYMSLYRERRRKR